MARRVKGDNGSLDEPRVRGEKLKRLYAAHVRSEQIASLVPDAAAYRAERLPSRLAELLSNCGCGLLFSVVKACLIRLAAESIAPTVHGGTSRPKQVDDLQRNSRGQRGRRKRPRADA